MLKQYKKTGSTLLYNWINADVEPIIVTPSLERKLSRRHFVFIKIKVNLNDALDNNSQIFITNCAGQLVLERSL